MKTSGNFDTVRRKINRSKLLTLISLSFEFSPHHVPRFPITSIYNLKTLKIQFIIEKQCNKNGSKF